VKNQRGAATRGLFCYLSKCPKPPACDGVIGARVLKACYCRLPSRGSLRNLVEAPLHLSALSTVNSTRDMAENDNGSSTADAPKKTDPKELKESDLQYIQYEPSKEEQYLPAIRQLISKDLSEPYSIYVYRYFLYQWGDLCYMVWATLCIQSMACLYLPLTALFTGALPNQCPDRRDNM
jgi:hypothetical protein